MSHYTRMYKFLVLFLFIIHANAQYEGESCSKDGRIGMCVNLNRCRSANDGLKQGITPETCSFDVEDPIVCCFDKSGPQQPQRPQASYSRPQQTSNSYGPSFVNSYEGKCEPIDPSLTSPKTGQKAWDKCVEYQEQLVYPCGEGELLIPNSYSRGTNCNHNADQLIIGGEDAQLDEFPHMVLLGFGEEPEVRWECGGTLISDRFILTAGHCAMHRDAGKVTQAAFGVLRRNDISKSSRRRIIEVIRHPQYSPIDKRNDIMLLKTDTSVQLDRFVVPACLHVGDPVDDTQALATGWGYTTSGGNLSNVLQKVLLNKFSHQECQRKLRKNRITSNGINDSTQMCYGDKLKPKDACQGDSGGPLQINSRKINCMYVIIGITSFGKQCGIVELPGIYTRVAYYVPWIESVVWPGA